MAIAGFSDEQWRELEKEYKNNLASIEYPIPFRTQMRAILGSDNSAEFSRKTGLTEYMYGRMKSQICKEDLPQRNSLISVCIGYGVSLEETEKLLNSLGLCFQPYHIRDYAYRFLFEHCSGKSVDECNEVLRDLGIAERYWLGKYARKNK